MSLTAGIIGAAGIAGAGIGAFGANSAAGQQAGAANNAADLSAQESQNALNFQKQQYNNSLQLLQPYYNTGVGALDMLRFGLGIPGNAPSNFQFPGSTGSTSTAPNLFPTPGDLRSRELGNGGPGIRPIQAEAAGATVPFNRLNEISNSGGTATLPGQSLGNDSAGAGVLNLTGEGGTPGVSGGTTTVPAAGVSPISANNGTLQVPMNGGGTDSSANGNLGFGSLLQSYPGGPFVAPDSVTEQNDPGYQFRLQQGLDQMTNSAAARGGLLSGGTEKAMEDFAQNDASN